MKKYGTLDRYLAFVRNKARLDDMAIISPLVCYPASEINYPGGAGDYDDVWAVLIGASHDTPKGPEFHCDQVLLGTVMGDLPEALMAAVDCAWVIKRPNDLRREEAESQRHNIARTLKKDFADVRLFEDKVECLRFCAARWPGDKIAALAAKVAAERGDKRGLGCA